MTGEKKIKGTNREADVVTKSRGNLLLWSTKKGCREGNINILTPDEEERLSEYVCVCERERESERERE